MMYIVTTNDDNNSDIQFLRALQNVYHRLMRQFVISFFRSPKNEELFCVNDLKLLQLLC
jgi:hypothetical protein